MCVFHIEGDVHKRRGPGTQSIQCKPYKQHMIYLLVNECIQLGEKGNCMILSGYDEVKERKTLSCSKNH